MDDVEIIERGLTESYSRFAERLARSKPRVTILGAPPPTEDELVPFSDALRATNVFRAVEGWWIWAKGRQNVVTSGWVAEWAFPRWNPDPEIPKIGQNIHRVLSQRQAPISLYTAIWGARLNGSHSIDDAISIHAFPDLKATKGNDFGGHMLANPQRFLGSYAAAVSGEPTLSMHIKMPAFPFLASKSHIQRDAAQDLISRSETACMCLVAFGTRSPVIDLSWFEYEDSVLDGVWHEETRFWRMPEVVPNAREIIDVDLQRYGACYKQFAKLAEPRRARYESSLKRYELSLARRKVSDRAIDLCTAFEQLLGSGGNVPISWSNGLRCALVIGGEEAAKRRTRDIVQCLYRIRNTAVHGGETSSKVNTLTMDKVHSEDLLAYAQGTYCDLVELLVSLDDDPDWFDLETTGKLP
jgi:hypothetical protein